MIPRSRSGTRPDAVIAAWLVVLLVASSAAVVLALRGRPAEAGSAMWGPPHPTAAPPAATGTVLLPLTLRLRAAEN